LEPHVRTRHAHLRQGQCGRDFARSERRTEEGLNFSMLMGTTPMPKGSPRDRAAWRSAGAGPRNAGTPAHQSRTRGASKLPSSRRANRSSPLCRPHLRPAAAAPRSRAQVWLPCDPALASAALPVTGGTLCRKRPPVSEPYVSPARARCACIRRSQTPRVASVAAQERGRAPSAACCWPFTRCGTW
jgi:hypothetical protein